MARAKRSASGSPERGRKRKKVVLVKAQVAAEKAAEKEQSRPAPKATVKKSQNRAKPAPIPGGTAGRLLEWLGHSQRPDRSQTEQADVQVPAPPVSQARSPDTKLKPNTQSKAPVPRPASDSDSSESRSSPSRSPSPMMAPAVVPPPPPLKTTKRPKAASPKKVKKTIAPPAAKAKKVATADGPSFPVKAKKASAEPTTAAPAKTKKVPEADKPVTTQLVPPPSAPQSELSELDQTGLQEAVLERLRSLCDKDVDPKVLAEYIVVLAQMNKGPDHLSGELEAFFSDKASLESFVKWVEDCKWSFVPGGSPTKTRSMPQTSNGKGSQPVDFWGPAPTGDKTLEGSAAGPKSVRRGSYPGTAGPHVAVTSRVVLQPNPNFDASPAKAPTSTSVSKVAAKVPARTTPYAMPPPHSAEAQKVHLLGDLTKTLQTILTKLQDRELPDSQRERYQAMADKIHIRIKAINLPGAARRR
mmetsp:Transcript_45638/g.85196  ORF Transcript_45638/g.85196 Transcript_45638/m.85196 type:complete len:471 (-) Transcript_45638:78-1490(-)